MGSAAGGGIEVTDGFFAWDAGVLCAELGVARAVVVGRVVVGRVVLGLDVEASEVRGVALTVDESAAGRDVKGRFAVAVLEGVMVDLRSEVAVLPGDDLVAAVEDSVVLRDAGFLFSSPDVMEAKSGSASEVVDLEANPARLAAVPGAGRVGGLFKLDPAVLVRIVELARGLDAVVDARVEVDDGAAGRRAPTGAVPPTSGRRGGTLSGLDAVEEAILRRAVVADVGVPGVFCEGELAGSTWDGCGRCASPVSVPLGGSSAIWRCG